MGVKFAYGKSSKIKEAIESGVIPVNSIIITKDSDNEAELFFYDAETKLKHIIATNKFSDMDAALEYAALASTAGNIITVLVDGLYHAYTVQSDGTLTPTSSGSVDPETPSDSLLGRVEALETKAHTHTNKTVLDTITAEMMSQWNSAADAIFGVGTDGRLVKSSDSVNGVMIAEDGTMSVNNINILKIVQDDEDEIIIRSSLVI